MLNYYLNNNLFRLSVLLVFLGITCRILFFWFFGKEHLNFEVSSIPVLYYDAIQNHTWEFIKTLSFQTNWHSIKRCYFFSFIWRN